MNNKYDAKVFVKVAEKIDADKQLKFFKSKVNLLRVLYYLNLNRSKKCQIFSLLKLQWRKTWYLLLWLAHQELISVANQYQITKDTQYLDHHRDIWEQPMMNHWMT